MLYIFLVNTGKMMTFEMNLALDTVENLKNAIFDQYQIPVSQQVLLISGGESLNLSDRVCKYSSAGTDTSPIFLFSKTSEIPLPLPADPEVEEDMKDRVESCLQMEANFNTVAARAEMAHQLYETDKMIYGSCDKLVHDQHYQQQGWAAVVANLEDIVKSFKNKAIKVEQLYNDIQKNKSVYYELLNSFESDKEILARIPILKSLYSSKNETVTLLDWILRKDQKSSLDELYCLDELNHFDQEKLDNLKADIEMTLKKCDSPEMKEIRGLEVRLSALDKLMFDAKKVYDKQGILTKGFNQNQTRMSDLRDTSILPDLCQNHKEQLQIMLKNHIDLIDYKFRCLNAKKELSENLHQRLRWIVHIEEQLKHTDEILVIYGLKLKKLREKLEIIQNLHLAPQIYLNSIVEVLRRRSFSESFYKWSKSVSQLAREMINAEVERREQSSAQLEKHFLKLFFPGMNDLPENFTTDFAPIDQTLPQISFADLDYLREQLPDMSAHLVVPSPVPLPLQSPFDDYETPSTTTPNAETLSRSTQAEECSPMQRSLAQPIECQNVSLGTSMTAKEIAQLESAKADLEGCLTEKNSLIEDLVQQLAASEEKYKHKERHLEKFSQLNAKVLELVKSLRGDAFEEVRSQLADYSKSFLDDLQSAGLFLEQLKDQMEMEKCQFSRELEQKNESISVLEEKLTLHESEIANLNATCQVLTTERDDGKGLILSQICEIEKLKEDIEKRNLEKDRQQLVVEQLNAKVQNLKASLNTSKEEITRLLHDFIQLEMPRVAKQFEDNVDLLRKESEANLRDVEAKLAQAKDADVARLREQLSQEHKNELESLRHRFKLAISTTSIERTSSETSLEKVQLDIVDQSAKDEEIQKMRTMLTDLKAENEQSISKLRAENEAQIQAIRAELERERKLITNESVRKILNDPEFNPELVIQRVKIYETLLARVTNRLSVDVESLDQTKCQEVLSSLQQDVGDSNRNLEMTSSSITHSFISIPTTPDSPKQMSKDIDAISSKYKIPKNLELIQPNSEEKISVTSCEIGDNVLVYYEKKVDNFIVFTLTSNLHYIHSDSLKECDFGKEVQPNEFQWIIAKVLDKEYCQIKKEENRYKLPLNTKFYRVKIKQISKCNSSPLKQDQGNLMNRSYMPSTSNRTIFSNIFSLFSPSADMSRSAIEPNNN